MEFGMFHEFPSLPGRSETEMFDEAMEQVDAAERWGLDAMWLAEIHFAPERTYLSAPLTIASAIAARTRRMKIGIAVQVLPLCHPLRLAEEAATVDQISHGRLIFGVGRSGVVSTYDAYQVPYDESRERFAEMLDIVKKAWTEAAVLVRGQVPPLRERRAVVPKPYQKPLPRDPHRRQHARHVPGDRRARLSGLRQHAAPDLDRSGAADREPISGPTRRPATRARARSTSSAPIYIAETEERARDEARGKRQPFLPAAIRADRRVGAPLRPADLYRARRAAAHADL